MIGYQKQHQSTKAPIVVNTYNIDGGASHERCPNFRPRVLNSHDRCSALLAG